LTTSGTSAASLSPSPADADCALQVNRVVLGDNLDWMSRLPNDCCQLIYADPPFNSNRKVANRSRPGCHFDDRHIGGLARYLHFLRPRLAQMRRLLTPTGAVYVHLDWRTVHYVKVMLDELFGPESFLNEIIWHYRSGGRPGRWFPRKHDTILLYVKHAGRHFYKSLRGQAYRTKDLLYDEEGRPYKTTRKGRLYFSAEGAPVTDVWDIPFLSTVSSERVAYPTQKPEALLERIIEASSREGDLVADFFCGSGTTLVVAKRLGRRYLGCDSNAVAVNLARRRLQSAPYRDEIELRLGQSS
jgi:site-specific DNA-methyltransferase (adenine-specific)